MTRQSQYSILVFVRAVRKPDEYCARVAQLVEHDLAKVGVAGSSPVSRSFLCSGNADKYGVSAIFILCELWFILVQLGSKVV